MTDHQAGLRRQCEAIQRDLKACLAQASLPRMPDSRAVGSAVQEELLDHWPELCGGWGATPEPTPGPKTMYDAALILDETFWGIDFTTKRLQEEGYSDGGVCSVADLFRFLVRTDGLFLVAQVRYTESDDSTDVDRVTVAPLHSLPIGDFSIANLGTGQVRLARAIDECSDEIDWDRTVVDFLSEFAVTAQDFYKAGAKRMLERKAAVAAMVNSGFTETTLR